MNSAARTTKRAKNGQGHANGRVPSVPPLQNGDHLTQKEFHRRYLAMPELRKAELINGIVYIPSEFTETQDPTIPPLCNGDHLTVAEFERRYENMPGLKKAELIDGVVYMSSPVRWNAHAEQDSALMTWLGHYRAYTSGVELGGNATMKLEEGENQPQPEAALRIEAECGGQSRLVKGYLVGSPELAAEVSASSVSYDLNQKYHSFEKNGIREYIVWRVDDEEIDWFILKRGIYQRLAKTKDGLCKSKVFPGLWLDPAAIVAGDMIRVLDVVQKGIASLEHRRFVEKLRARKK